MRFTTSGSLATMYAILLARAFTGRDLVMKVGGGWHGAQPWARSSAAACRWRPWPAGRTYCDWWREEDCFDPSMCDITPSHKVLDLALLLENVFMLHSHGLVSTAHTEADIEFLGEACRQVARRVKPYL